jgi:hypothetical protein
MHGHGKQRSYAENKEFVQGIPSRNAGCYSLCDVQEPQTPGKGSRDPQLLV